MAPDEERLPGAPRRRSRVIAVRRSVVLAGGMVVLILFGSVVWAYQRLRDIERQNMTFRRLKDAAVALEYLARDRNFYLKDCPLTVRGRFATNSQFRRRDRWVPPDAWPLALNKRLSVASRQLAAARGLSIETEDGWGHPILLGLTEDGQRYTLLSTGADGLVDPSSFDYWNRTEFWRDIVLADGEWRSAPRNFTR